MAGMRSRWAAIGAAVAVTVGAGGLATAVAQGNDDPSTFNPLSPQRVLDTRDGTGTGGTTNPLGPGATFNLDIDGRAPLVAGATGVMLNVTIVDGTEPSYLTVYPKAGTRPLASNLNWYDAQAKPNLVAVPFGQDGDISFYNYKGNVHVVADVVGYYSPAAYPEQLGAMSRYQPTLVTTSVGGALSFDASGAQVGSDVTYDADSNTFTLGVAGTYRVSYGYLVDNDAASLAGSTRVEVGGAGVGAVREFPSGSGGLHEISDSQLVTTSAAGASLRVVVLAGGPVITNHASISIERIA